MESANAYILEHLPRELALEKTMIDRGRERYFKTVARCREQGFESIEMVGHGFRSMASTLLNEQGFKEALIKTGLWFLASPFYF